MTSSMTSQSDLKVVSLYSFMNDKITFFMITEERTNKDIIFKLSVHMYHWNVNMRLQAILEYFVDDVIRSQNKSKLWTTIALSKFELEKRSTAQNVANWTGYQKFKFQFHIQISKFWQVSNLRLPFHYCCHFRARWSSTRDTPVRTMWSRLLMASYLVSSTFPMDDTVIMSARTARWSSCSTVCCQQLPTGSWTWPMRA